MRRWLILLSLISTLTYSQIYKSEILDISTNESLIIGKTSRLNFHMSIVIDENNASYDDFLKLNVEDTDFIKVVNLHIKNNKYRSTSDGISFVDRNDRLNDEMELTISGTFIFNWNKNRRNIDRIEDIKIGYVNNEHNLLVLSLPILYLNPISNVKVEVIEDMDLGTVFTGEKLTTKQGTPAKIRIEGVKDKSVKITIPNTESWRALEYTPKFTVNGNQMSAQELQDTGITLGGDGTQDINVAGSLYAPNNVIVGDYSAQMTIKVSYKM